jgi:hypothetical protein
MIRLTLIAARKTPPLAVPAPSCPYSKSFATELIFVIEHCLGHEYPPTSFDGVNATG